ncbi:MAG: alanine--tRNA ligase [Thaumarchaeota archaeon]|nr:alanine--tRNA ligase [Candidatus Calditenuaceae archaeon]MDW8187463.1 alanine--tRNA ligase [Nitrososphaerota archaeon]
MEFDVSAYDIEYLRSRGFMRRRCKVCGKHFWTLDPERDNCNEAPCVPYEFIGSPPTRRRYTLDEMRDAFIGFFAERGHEPIDPYPVVPRWRRDLYLVSASVVDFQPHVTSGLMEPPANPLVVSQPCIRLVDVDKVGLTLGRHMTIFEMGGAHAFNFPNREVYWKDRTVELCSEFLESLGVDEEEVVYKEGVWSGGGNAGPCFEVNVGGLEIATLVFMSYKVLDGGLEELPVRTVDTGYGIERFAWMSTGSPTAFEVVYAPILSEAERLLGSFRVDPHFLHRYGKYSAWIQPGGSVTIAEARNRAAQLASVDLRSALKNLESLERFYASLDYSKSVAFIISEGVVPSNTRVGYLARLLIRRLHRTLNRLGADERLIDLLDLQLRFWGRRFRQLLEAREDVLELVDYEVRKFSETLAKGSAFLERTMRELKSTGGKVTTDLMIRLYDERGLPPDLVREVALGSGVDVEAPENVQEIVASMHVSESPKPESMDQIGLAFSSLVRGLPPTERLFYVDQYRTEFEAKVLAAERGAVVLSATCFYAEGGGQVADTGIIEHSSGSCRVEDVQSYDGVIVHFVQGELPVVGEVVKGRVDRERRLSIMRHHTATHILIGTVRRVLGRHAWQMGARKEENKARLDVSHYKSLTEEELRRIERLANEVVARRLPVEVKWAQRHEAERTFGFTLYQGGEAPAGVVRVVIIPEWDAEACGGTHCSNTSEVGFIKVLSAEKIADGVVRLEYAAGPAALEYVQSQLEKLGGELETLRAENRELSLHVEKFLEQVGAERPEELETLQSCLRAHYALAARAWFGFRRFQKEERAGSVRVVFDYLKTRNNALISEMLQTVNNVQEPTVILLFRQEPSGLGVWLSVNRQAASHGLRVDNLRAAIRASIGSEVSDSGTRALRFEVSGLKVGELYSRLLDIITGITGR